MNSPELFGDSSSSDYRIAMTADSIGPYSDEIERIFASFISDYQVPGVAYGIIAEGGLIYSKGLGTVDVESEETPTDDHIFRIASMTKSFTALSVLILRDRGEISLEDPLEKWMPEAERLIYPTTDSPKITIRMLLSMAAGLVEDDPWADRQLAMDPQHLVNLMDGRVAFDHVPQTKYEYSNLGYALLGQVVKAVSGLPLKVFAKRSFLDPLGMTSTTWDPDTVPAGLGAKGYRVEDSRWVEEPISRDGAFGAMGGLCSSVSDMAKFISLHLSAWPARDGAESQVVRRSTLREMSQIQVAMASGLREYPGDAVAEGYGFGLTVVHHRRLGRVVAHGGMLPGFSSRMEWLPDYGIAMVALANRTYMPINKAVRSALDYLCSQRTIAHKVTASKELLRAQKVIVGLYKTSGQQVVDNEFYDTYFMDLDDQRRGPDFDELRKSYGDLVALGDLETTGNLRGAWLMRCANGNFRVNVTLGPLIPVKIQFVRVNEDL